MIRNQIVRYENGPRLDVHQKPGIDPTAFANSPVKSLPIKNFTNSIFRTWLPPAHSCLIIKN